MSRMLVVGARPGSLGAAVRNAATSAGMTVATAGVWAEDMPMNVLDVSHVNQVMEDFEPHHVVCTVGVNAPSGVYDHDWVHQVAHHLQVNVMGVATVLQQWLYTDALGVDADLPGHFVAVSSNSAHVARTASAPYCASKAALSMLMRSAAREMALKWGHDRIAYAYEPGLLATTQTNEVRARLGSVPMHRMPGRAPDGLSPHWLADLIVRNVLTEGAHGLNGTTIRLDAGEQ